MKVRKEIVTLFLLFCINTLIAQNIGHSIYIDYVHSLPDASNEDIVLPDDTEYKSEAAMQPGFSIGYRMVLSKENFDFNIGLESSILRHEINTTKTITDLSFGGGGIQDFVFPGVNTNLYFVSIPISLRFKLNEGSRLGFRIGTSIDYLVGKREKNLVTTLGQDTLINGAPAVIITEDYEIDTDKTGFNAFNITAQLGLDYEINEKYKVNFSINRKMLNIYDDYYLSRSTEEEVKLNLNLYTLRVGLECRIK